MSLNILIPTSCLSLAMIPDNFEVLFVMKLMCVFQVIRSSMRIPRNFVHFTCFIILSLIVTFAGVFTFFPLVLNMMKLVLSTFRVSLLEFNH